MSIPNLIALFLLSGTLLRLVRGALDGSRAPRGPGMRFLGLLFSIG